MPGCAHRPDAATRASRRVQQLAAMVLLLAKAADGLVDALQAVRPQVVTPSSTWRPQPRTLMPAWDEDGYPDAE